MDFLILSNTCLLNIYSITWSWLPQSKTEGHLASFPEELMSSWPHLLLHSSWLCSCHWLSCSSSDMLSSRLVQCFSCFFHLNSSCSSYLTLLTSWLKIPLVREALPDSPCKRSRACAYIQMHPFTIPFSYFTFLYIPFLTTLNINTFICLCLY